MKKSKFSESQIVIKADKALYRFKHAGRTVSLFGLKVGRRKGWNRVDKIGNKYLLIVRRQNFCDTHGK